MAEQKITVRNTLNGEVAEVRPAVLKNPHLSKHLVEVEPGSRKMNLASPTTADEYKSRRVKVEDIEDDTPEPLLNLEPDEKAEEV